MTTNEELSLVKRVKNGDKDSLSKLWDEINPKLYGYLVNVLKDREKADDILQSTWLKAIENINKFKDRGVRFSAWLFAIAKNECKQFWRQNNRVSVGLGGVELGESIKMTTGLENNVLIDGILEKLSPDEREILRLRFIGQLNFKEIAKVLEISIISARVRLHRALKKAQKLV